jgi:hypothetical protein
MKGRRAALRTIGLLVLAARAHPQGRDRPISRRQELNARTANMLGIAIPKSILIRADREIA